MKKIVLMYHDVYCIAETESGFQYPTSFLYKVGADQFESHVCFARDYCNLRGIPLNTIEFTFDDGGESFYRVIAPILEKYGFKGVFFISTSFIDTEKFLTKEQVVSLHQRGHIIASHSHSHPRNMTKLSMSELLFEWKTSKEILENILHTPITIASIPSGYSSSNVVEAAVESGLKTLYTSKPIDKPINLANITAIGRYVIHRNTSQIVVERIISNDWFRKKLFLRWCLISIIKRLLGANYNKIKKCLIR